jgi:ribosomal protein L21E
MEEEALARLVQNLRIELSEAEAQLAALKEAQATKQKAQAERCKVDDTLFSTGDLVRVIWDRQWSYGKSKKSMPKTAIEGKIGTVVRVSECYVWVRFDGNNELYQKRKHNVTRVGRS